MNRQIEFKIAEYLNKIDFIKNAINYFENYPIFKLYKESGTNCTRSTMCLAMRPLCFIDTQYYCSSITIEHNPIYHFFTLSIHNLIQNKPYIDHNVSVKNLFLDLISQLEYDFQQELKKLT